MREQILEDLKSAMKNQDKEALAVIRGIKGAMQLEEIAKKHELNDEEVIDVIVKQIKMRKESIEGFEKGNREDLKNQALREIEILNRYMPEQLSLDEVNNIIEETFNLVNPTSLADMGKIMREVTPKVKGKYDMKEVSNIIKNKLSNLKGSIWKKLY